MLLNIVRKVTLIILTDESACIKLNQDYNLNFSKRQYVTAVPRAQGYIHLIIVVQA